MFGFSTAGSENDATAQQLCLKKSSVLKPSINQSLDLAITPPNCIQEELDFVTSLVYRKGIYVKYIFIIHKYIYIYTQIYIYIYTHTHTHTHTHIHTHIT
jgi:hypothetical protein